MTDAAAARRNHSAVSFPTGAYDRQALAEGLDKAAGAAPDQRADALTEAVDTARAEGSPASVDTTLRIDQKVVEREHERLPGVIERVRVFDPESEGAKTVAEEAERRTESLEGQSAQLADATTSIEEPGEPGSETDPAGAATAGEDGGTGSRRRTPK